jgi:hypothetical protein
MLNRLYTCYLFLETVNPSNVEVTSFGWLDKILNEKKAFSGLNMNAGKNTVYVSSQLSNLLMSFLV